MLIFNAIRLVLGATLGVLFLTSRLMAEDQPTSASPSYAVVVSAATQADPAWRAVAEALVAKHTGASLIEHDGDLASILPRLQALRPRFTCFVARPEEAGREPVRQIHQLTRRLDDDPYTDTQWGIVTGYDARAALQVVAPREPLLVCRVAAGTPVALQLTKSGRWYSELEQGQWAVKEPGGEVELRDDGPSDTTQALINALAESDLFITSGHATERDWQIGYRYKNGQFRCRDGRLFGLDTQGQTLPIDAPGPRVYLAVGNCLMGHVDGPDAIALAWMNNAGVAQMVGYTDLTWFGYAGWGCLDYFLEQPGRYTLAEAWLANQHALIHRLESGLAPRNDRRGLEYDRDIVAFFGDPAWTVRTADGPNAFDQSLTLADDGSTYTFLVTPRQGAQSFEPIDTNGSQRGGRPFVAFLPDRIQDPVIVEDAERNPTITDDFILVPRPPREEAAQTIRVVFQARPATP